VSTADPVQVLEKILADPEFQGDWRETLGKWIETQWSSFAKWLERLPGVDRAVILVVCLLFLGAIAWSVVRGLREGADPKHASESRPPEKTPPASPAGQLAEHARALAARGRLREAARTLQQAVYRALADREGVDWDGARADWEWVARLGGESGLDAFTAQAQLAAYGTAVPDAGGFEGLWSRAQRWVAA
jgi:hypothetical protein